MPTVRERFQAVMLHGDVSLGFPVIEWASWWDQTVRSWVEQGAPAKNLEEWFDLDVHRQIWVRPRGRGCPAVPYHGGPVLSAEWDYDRLLAHLFKLPSFDVPLMERYRAEQERGDSILWLTLEGPFWFPRTLFGIHEHLLAFYDQPQLMKRMNEDLAEFSIRAVDAVCQHFTPDFITFAEDMSYNHGPMISYDMMDEFMKPYYQRVIPALTKRGIIPIIDSDGFVESLIPWFRRQGLQGILPLERMAGVDVNRIRGEHPDWRMVGGFDKTVMHKGEEALRNEFARIRPAVLAGYFIPSCDHQTPPAVSVADYRLYVRLMREFSSEVAALASRTKQGQRMS